MTLRRRVSAPRPSPRDPSATMGAWPSPRSPSSTAGHARRRGDDPGHRRRAAARRRRLRGRPPLRRPARSRSTSTSRAWRARRANLRLQIDLDAVRADVDALLAAAGPVDGAAALPPHARRPPHRRSIEALPARRRRSPLRDASPTRRRACSTASSRSATRRTCSPRGSPSERGADEALLVTPHGRVLEAPTSSFFCVARTADARARRRSSDHILDSITRRRAAASCPTCARSAVTRDELRGAEEAFLASTTREVQPIVTRSTTSSCPPRRGPLTPRAARARSPRTIAAELGA